MPETRIPGRTYPSGHADPQVHAIMALLEDWFTAMEDGTAHYRQPDFEYRRSEGKPQWSEDDVDRLVKAIDAEIDQEVLRLPGTTTHSTAGPGFHRLEFPQRLALAQQLDGLLHP